MQNPDIRDIASLKRLVDEAGGVKQLKSVFPFMKPVLQRLGVDAASLEAILDDPRIDELIQGADELVGMAGRFNNVFAQRGWIMYEMLRYELARAAVLQAEGGDIDGAEQLLANSYDA